MASLKKNSLYKRQSVGVVYGFIKIHCTLMKFLSIFQCITPKNFQY
jgi:hypothetical protein